MRNLRNRLLLVVVIAAFAGAAHGAATINEIDSPDPVKKAFNS